MLNRTRFSGPRKFFWWFNKANIMGSFREIFYYFFAWKCILCVLVRTDSSRVEKRNNISKLSLFSSWRYWLELPGVSNTNVQGPEDVWDIEVRLYIELKNISIRRIILCFTYQYWSRLIMNWTILTDTKHSLKRADYCVSYHNGDIH